MPAEERIELEDVAEDLRRWTVGIAGFLGPPYAGGRFRLRVIFPQGYPYDPPEVVFAGSPPAHARIDSDGHICPTVFGAHWPAARCAHDACMSIVPMLRGCTVTDDVDGLS